ncbi:MAG: ribonuclease H-like domain-containing protein [Candidatus Portnoybacteria bacterium]|nr:ribonuclease H-like domain-containing protein [Candidatus Portnoybacteria bacterium]
MNKLFLDIETLPASEEQRGNLKILFEKQKKKLKGCTDFEKYISLTSFDGCFGQILCIGYALNNEPAQILCNDKNEKETLGQFWNLAKNADLFIGHNVMDFDLRFIYQRSSVLGVRPTKEMSFARYRNFPIFDTMKEWAKWGKGDLGLEYVALALGIPTPKKGIDGSQVSEFYKKGKLDEILEYCKRDVETTRAIYKRIVFEDLT